MRKDAGDAELMEAVRIAGEVGDDWTAAYASGTLALWLLHMGRTAEAAEHLTLIERIADQCADELLLGLAGCVRGQSKGAPTSRNGWANPMRPADGAP